MSKFIPNSFQIPNIIVDELMAELSGAELKCYLAIVRKTKGWGKDEDAISITQLMELTGLSNRKVIDGCNALIKMGLLSQKNGVRGIKILSINPCTNFTSEKSSPVKKVHGTREESSLVTSEESSHTKDNIKNTTKKTNINISPASEKKSILAFALENDVDETLAEEFIRYRKSLMKKPLTLRALKGIAREAQKAKMALSDVLELVMEKTWRGFEAAWVDEPKVSSEQSPIDCQAVIDAYNEILGDRLVPMEMDSLAEKQILTLRPHLKDQSVNGFALYFQAFADNASGFYFEPERKIGFSFLMKPETLVKARRGEL